MHIIHRSPQSAHRWNLCMPWTPNRRWCFNIVSGMYTIQFGSRAHFLDDDAAESVLSAMKNGEQFVTVPIDLAADNGENYIVTLNVSHIVAVFKHRRDDTSEASRRPVK